MQIRVGYHDTRDDSVSSSLWDSTKEMTHDHIAELLDNEEIDAVWVRISERDPLAPNHLGSPVFLKGEDEPRAGVVEV